MLKSKSTRRKNYDDVFDFFEKESNKAFGFLLTAHGFERLPAKVELDWDDRERYVISYRSETSEVQLMYSTAGEYVSCSLSRLERRRDGGAKYVDAYGIDFLIAARCPEREVIQEYEKSTNEDVTRILQTYAEVLRDHGQDALAGEPQAFLEMKREVDRETDEIIRSGTVIIYTEDPSDDGPIH